MPRKKTPGKQDREERDEDAIEGVIEGEVVSDPDVDADHEPTTDPDGEPVAARRKRSTARTEKDAGDGDEDHEAAEDGEPAEGEPSEEEGFDADVLEGEVVDVGEAPLPIAARSDTGAIAPLDPLQAYMRDVQRYSLLTPEETRDLAVRYVETGDVDAARKLVTANLRLVVKIAYDYRRAYRNILDLVQEGNIGLMQAVRKYDPYKGVKLSSYAAWWIRAYILRFILNNWRLVKLGTTQAQRKLFFNLKKEKAKLAAMGIDPTPETIAARLDVPVDEVIHMDRRLSSGEASLDAPISMGEGRPTTRVELLAGSDRPIDEALASEELHGILTDKIREFGRTLKGKEQIIFEQRLMAEEPKTLQELGEEFGVSRERVRQIEKRLQGKIRDYLEEHVEGSALS